MKRILTAFMVSGALLWCFSSEPAFATKSVKVNFNSMAKITETCGVEHTATPCSLTAQQKADVLAKAQAKYDAILGAGKVTFMEGSGGDVDMVVSGADSPASLDPEYGDAGQSGKPGIVHEGRFTAQGCTGDALVNALSETLAHEVGHKCGLDHNWDNPPTLMTEGGHVDKATRNAGTRGFTNDDKKSLEKNEFINNAEHRSIPTPGLRNCPGSLLTPPLNTPDEGHYQTAYVKFQGPIGTEFGYMSFSNEFVFQRDLTTPPTDCTFVTFPYGTGVDIAVKRNNTVYCLSKRQGTLTLSNPNPNRPQFFRTAVIEFDTDGDLNPDAFINLDATVESTTGGFREATLTVPSISEENLILLTLLLAGTAVWMFRKRRIGAAT